MTARPPDVAFLVYAPLKQRRQDNSFDGNDNVGAQVIKDALERANIQVGFCGPDTADRYRLILVSLTSTHDVYAFYRQVALRPSWQPARRQFMVLAGGFGMQNPTPIRHYVDYAAFGRYEHRVVDVVTSLLGGVVPELSSLMHLPDLHPVEIEQTATLYPHILGDWQETFTGCPLKCKFCHYTFARKHLGSDEAYAREYVQTSLTGTQSSPEVTWDQIVNWPQKAGRLRVAIDGFSQRLRYIYGKRISAQDIIDGLENIGSYGGNTVVMTYNISHFPSETPDDWLELQQTIARAKPHHRVIFVLHSTPFRPSLSTPMQWEPVSLTPDISRLRSSVILESPKLRAVHSFTLETPWTHLMAVVAERATPVTDQLFHAICFAPGLQRGLAQTKLRIASEHFNLSPYLRRYELDEPPPAAFLRTYISLEQMRIMAKTMRGQIEHSLSEPGWVPGQKSMVKRDPVKRHSIAKRLELRSVKS